MEGGSGDPHHKCMHRENAESASTRLGVPEAMGIPYKRVEALSVLTIGSKCVEAYRIAVCNPTEALKSDSRFFLMVFDQSVSR